MGTPVSVKIQARVHFIESLFYCAGKRLVGVFVMSAIAAVLEECGNVKATPPGTVENLNILLIIPFTKPHAGSVCVKIVQNIFGAVPYVIDVYCQLRSRLSMFLALIRH